MSIRLWGKSKIEKEIERMINDMKLYLENNYKDLAIQSRKDTISYVEKMYTEGKLNAKRYSYYKNILNQYTKEMENYNHQQFYRT